MEKKLIFDLGFLDGTDSLYYLKEGYKVVAVEANPYVCKNFKIPSEYENDFTLLHTIMEEEYLEHKPFYINKERPEVSSVEKWIATQNGKYSVEEVTIDCLSLFDLIDTYGVPYYVKVDIEGVDKIVAEQIASLLEDTPEYVSFELNKNDYIDIFYMMKEAGYKRFKLVNQINNQKNSSGAFGDKLDNWLDFHTALSHYMKYRELKIIDNVNLGVGWIDLHCGKEG